MEASSNRHHRYITASTSGITILRMIDSTFNDNPLPLLQKLMRAYDNEVLNSSLNHETLEVFYKVLCYEYQLKFNSKLNGKCGDDFTGFPITKILKYLMKREEGIENEGITVLFDIIILRITLHSNAEQLQSLFEYSPEVDKKIVDTDLYMLSIIDCITEALYLKSRFHNGDELNGINVTEICTSHLNQITTSLFRIENPQWKSFISILGKMIVTFDPNSIVLHLWETIFNANYNDYEKKITLLSCMIDDILTFPDDKIIESNIKYCIKDNFWKFIADGLTSDVEQQRKQALYIMKRVLEFIGKHKSKISSTNNIVPFVQCENADQAQVLEQAMIKFFLILESLEEKQAHLITPVLVHMRELMQVNIEHRTCGNCFDSIWLRCLFQRILHHKTNAVMKLGLLDLLKMDPTMFDEAFLLLLVQSLNNTSLYNNKSMDILPEISREMAGLFITAEYSQVALMNKFIQAVSRIIWAPSPLFYVFEALRITCCQLQSATSNIWSEDELEAIIRIMEKSLHHQSPPTREEIQVNICKIFYCCAKQPLDLKILAKTFSAFPSTKVMNRGSESWKLITDYLRSRIVAKEAAKFIRQSCEKLCFSDEDSQINLKSLALMIVLLYDGNKIFISKPCVVEKSLTKVLDLIRGADVRSYADKTLCLRTIHLIKCLLDVVLVVREKNITEEKSDYINHLIFPYLDPAQRYIFRSLKLLSSPKTYEEAIIYVESFRAIVGFNRFVHKSFNFSNDMKVFQDETMKILHDLNGIVSIRYWYNLQILYISSMCDMKSNVDDEKYENFLFRMCQQKLRIDDKSNTPNGGKIISECYETTAKFIKPFFIDFTDYVHIYFQPWLLNMRDMIDVGKEYVIAPIAGTIRYWFENAHDNLPYDSQIYESIIDVAWRNIWDAKKNLLFWSSIDQLIGLMLQTHFLNKQELTPIVIKHVEDIIIKSANTPNLRNILIHHLRELKTLDVLHFHDELIKCLLHVNVGRIDKRIEMQTCDYLMKQHEIFDFYQYTVTTSKHHGIYIDVLFRAECILLLLRVLTTVDKSYFSVERVLYFTSTLVSLKNKRYFADSNIHRIKHRIMQILLILQSFLDEEASLVLYNVIADIIVTDSDQPTVRVMQEWLITRIILKYQTHRDNIWDLLDAAKAKRPSSITSVASIIFHIARKLLVDKRVQYIRVAIRKLLSSCFNQTFVVRLHCQVVLLKLIEMTESLWNLSLDYTVIRDGLVESLRHGNLKTNSARLMDNFYFSVFDPMQDLDLQTIFYDLPRLLNMASDELICPEILSEIHSECEAETEDSNQAYCIRIMNKRNLLERLSTPKSRDSNDEMIFEQLEEVIDNPSCDIQKKIMPWKPMLPTDEDSTTLRQQKMANDVGLIVVASLIDGIPNLGGLSRTSEIFCARELVLANVNCVEQKEFQSLSVSSDKWITLTEVKPFKLQDYLLQMKSMGWTLVGAEQTANSISLLDVKFDKKTVLLLGNEKSGIPPNLIPLMDMCVEIPQAGVVRSLNVHVTGAICLWHYAKQHIFSDV